MIISPLRPTDSVRRLLIIRGDLRSRTGIAYDARAKMHLLDNDFDIVGVDVHPDPADRDEPFSYPIISDEEVPERLAKSQHRPVVLHHTPPDDFRGFPGAWNIGCFYWETDVAPRLRQWQAKIALMDAMWAPCSMIAGLIRSMGYAAPIHNIAWPFDFTQARRSDPRLRQSINVRLFGDLAVRDFEIRNSSLAEARLSARNLFVTVQSMAARKGLPILLREWHTHLSEAGNSSDLLILRLAFRHASNLSGSPEADFASMLQNAGFRSGQKTRIGIIAETLSHSELTATTLQPLRTILQKAESYKRLTFGLCQCGWVIGERS